VYTQVIEAGQTTEEQPPSPQFWGSKIIQSPPELGDLGGEKDLNEVSFDLCVHRSLPRGELALPTLNTMKSDISPLWGD
jgi:hypothetical protein